MTILFDSTRPANPGRHAFGRGVLPARDATALPVPLSDLEWAAATLNVNAVDFDVTPPSSFARDCDELGLVPPDLADYLSRNGLVGLADEMTDAYADEAERISGSRPSRESAEHSLAIAWFRLGAGR